MESNNTLMFQDSYYQNQQNYANEFLFSRNTSNNLMFNEEDYKNILNKNPSFKISK